MRREGLVVKPVYVRYYDFIINPPEKSYQLHVLDYNLTGKTFSYLTFRKTYFMHFSSPQTR